MVNRLSASASEIFAGAIQDYGRGIVIGSQTFGKGTVQTLIPLNRGQLKLTAAKFYRVSGESTQHQGVTPDIVFPTLVDDEQIGESTLDDAMPWDMIKPASFTPLSRLSSSIQTLQLRHEQRAANDPHFDYYRSLMARSELKSQKTTLSLNEETRRAEKSADDEWRLALENQLRIATNKVPAKDLDELEDLLEAESTDESTEGNVSSSETASSESEQTQPAQTKKAIAIVEDDPLLQEAGNIVADLARLGLLNRNGSDFAEGDYSELPSGVARAPAGT